MAASTTILEDQMQSERSARAETALATGKMAVSVNRSGEWQVASKGNFYTVTLENDAWACTCPDFAGRCQRYGLRCKHIEAVRFISLQENHGLKITEDHMTQQAPPSLSPAPEVIRKAWQDAVNSNAPDAGIPSSDTILWRLRQPLDMGRVKRRQAPGQGTVPYLEGYDVIEVANDLFQFRWSFDLLNEPHVMRWDKIVTVYDQYTRKKAPVLGEDGTPTTESVGIVYVTGRVVIEIGNKPYSHSDVGRCIYSGDTPEALDMAIAGAATDCLKRCFRQLGDQFGNSLYDKEIARVAGSTTPSSAGNGSPGGSPTSQQTANQDGSLKYSDGSLVDAANAAELNAFNAFKKASSGQAPQTREALRAWVQANNNGSNGKGKQ